MPGMGLKYRAHRLTSLYMAYMAILVVIFLMNRIPDPTGNEAQKIGIMLMIRISLKEALFPCITITNVVTASPYAALLGRKRSSVVV